MGTPFSDDATACSFCWKGGEVSVHKGRGEREGLMGLEGEGGRGWWEGGCFFFILFSNLYIFFFMMVISIIHMLLLPLFYLSSSSYLSSTFFSFFLNVNLAVYIHTTSR